MEAVNQEVVPEQKDEPCGHSFETEVGLLLAVKKFFRKNAGAILSVVKVTRQDGKSYAASAPMPLIFDGEFNTIQIVGARDKCALAKGERTAKQYELTKESYAKVGAKSEEGTDRINICARQCAGKAFVVVNSASIIPPPDGMCFDAIGERDGDDDVAWWNDWLRQYGVP